MIFPSSRSSEGNQARRIPCAPAVSAAALLGFPDRLKSEGADFPFVQAWRAEPEPGFKPATAWLAAAPDAFLVYAELDGAAVCTAATADQERLWELGDVFEILLQCSTSRGYFEFQVAPNGRRLQLRYPQPGLPLSEGIDPYLWPDGCLETAVEARPDQCTWRLAAVLPVAPLLAALPSGDALNWGITFCRYDYGADRSFVLSASAPFSAPSYHRLHEWTRIIVPGGFARFAP